MTRVTRVTVAVSLTAAVSLGSRAALAAVDPLVGCQGPDAPGRRSDTMEGEFENVRTVDEVASARDGEVSAHIKGLVTDHGVSERQDCR